MLINRMKEQLFKPPGIKNVSFLQCNFKLSFTFSPHTSFSPLQSHIKNIFGKVRSHSHRVRFVFYFFTFFVLLFFILHSSECHGQKINTLYTFYVFLCAFFSSLLSVKSKYALKGSNKSFSLLNSYYAFLALSLSLSFILRFLLAFFSLFIKLVSNIKTYIMGPSSLLDLHDIIPLSLSLFLIFSLSLSLH